MRQAQIVLCLAALLTAGCGSVNVKENLLTLDQNYFSESQENLTESQKNFSESQKKREIAIGISDSADPLNQAYKQVTLHSSDSSKDSQNLNASMANNQPLPSYLVKEPLVQKIVTAAYQALRENKDTVDEVTRSDISSMTKMLHKHLIANSPDPNDPKIAKLDSEKKIHKIILKYLSTYYSDAKDGFVNREGTVFKRPEIKNSIGNDVITAVVAISMEGLFDGLLSTPVYVDSAKKYQTSEGREPSVHRYMFTKAEELVSKGNSGIEVLELKGIRYLSGLAGDQSKTLSGALYRAFGGVEISFVIGGKISFGDNDTLAKILDTTFEVASKRIVEEGAYRGFKKLTVKVPVPAAHTDDASKITDGTSKAELLLKGIE